MTENQKPQEPSITVVLQADPLTTKQQLTTAAIQIGTAFAVPAMIAGVLAAVGSIGAVKQKIADRKLHKQTPDLTVVPSDPEE